MPNYRLCLKAMLINIVHKFVIKYNFPMLQRYDRRDRHNRAELGYKVCNMHRTSIYVVR